MLDLGLYWDMSEIRRKTVHHVAEQREKLVNDHHKWTSTMPNGLRVVTRTDQQEAYENRRRLHEEMRQRGAEETEGESAD